MRMKRKEKKMKGAYSKNKLWLADIVKERKNESENEEGRGRRGK